MYRTRREKRSRFQLKPNCGTGRKNKLINKNRNVAHKARETKPFPIKTKLRYRKKKQVNKQKSECSAVW